MTRADDVDVVIPVHNSAATIERVVRSVLGQRFDRFRLFVVDDRCSDGSMELVRAIVDPRISVVTSSRPGACAARNTGAAAGTAPRIAFLDADDEVDPEWLQVMVLEPVPLLVRCGYELVYSDGTTREEAVPGTSMLAGCFVVARPLFELVGGYDERFVFSENTDLEISLSAAVDESSWAPVVVDQALVRIHRQLGARAAKYSHEVLRDASELLIEKHGGRLSPTALASFSAVAGVNALQLGERRRARQHLRVATRYAPRRLKYWMRLAQTFVPMRAG